MNAVLAPWFGALNEPGGREPHRAHADDRIWTETNCYADLWIELIHGLGKDPISAFACALASDYDGVQWTFIKPAPEDLRRLYGLEVVEETLWRPVLDTVLSGPARGLLHTVEVDSYFLPDTIGTAYRTEHVKTTIVPLSVDADRGVMTYLHNAARHELADADFSGVFDFQNALPPYVEQISYHPDRVQPDALLRCVSDHLARRPATSPARRLADDVATADSWLPAVGMDVFHRWSFAVLRQCGAAAELTADLCVALEPFCPGASEGSELLRAAASEVKAIQFKMARMTAGRAVDLNTGLAALVDNWDRGVGLIAAAVGRSC